MIFAAISDLVLGYPVAFGFGTLFGLWLTGRYILVPRDRYERAIREADDEP